jgi:small basic protein
MAIITTSVVPPRTPAVHGLHTAWQSVVGTVIGLFVVVWGVPGVPDAFVNYLSSNAVGILVTVGVPSGIVSWLFNLYQARKV